MATNTIKTTDLAEVANIEFAAKFTDSARKLMDMLGYVRPMTAHPGTVLKSYIINGELSNTPRSEGEDIPLTKLTQSLAWSKEINLEFYRKETTAEAIAKSGYSVAVEKTDRKLVSLIQANVKSDLVDAFVAATTASEGFTPSTTTGTTIRAACLAAWAKLQRVSENLAPASDPVYFVSPEDFAVLVGGSDVTAAFGFQFVENVAGLGSIVSTAAIAQGTVYCTDKENMVVYAIDPSDIDGFEFYTDETGLVGVHHDTEYTNATLETVAVTAYNIFPEIANFVVKATVSA